MNKTENKLPISGLPPVGVCGSILGIWAEKADGSRRLLAGPFSNLVLDSGLDGFLTAGESLWPGYIYVSADTTAPVTSGSGPSSPSLVGGNAGSTSSVQAAVTIGSDTYTRFRQITIATSSIGGATGTWASLLLRTAKNLGNNATQPNTWNFAWSLIKDGGGSPTTVTVLSSERLVVQWAIDFYIKETATVQHATILGNAVDITWRPYDVDGGLWFEQGGNRNQGIDFSNLNNGTTPVSLTGVPSGTALRSSGATGTTYVAGSFQRAYNFSASTGSAGTINSIIAGGGQINYQGILDAGITIIAANTFTWQITMSYVRATDLGIS